MPSGRLPEYRRPALWLPGGFAVTTTVVNAFYDMLAKIGCHHPVHAALVHVPVGLLVGVLILGITAHLRGKSGAGRCARHCFVLALLFFFPAVLTGIMDWILRFDGTMLFPVAMKLILAAILCLLLAAGFYLGRGGRSERKSLLWIYAACVATVSGIGYFGGELVYGQRPPVTQQYRPGQQLYATHCAGCHPNGGNLMQPDLPVKNSPKTSTYTTFLEWLRKPDPPMPAVPPAALSDRQVRDLFDYTVNVVNKN